MSTRTRPVALVTGARRGMGRAISLHLARRGYDILAADHSEEGAEETRRLVEAEGGRFALHRCDLADLAQIPPMVDWAWREGQGIEVLVNNAGIMAFVRGDPLEVTPESWDAVLAVNSRAPFFVSQAVLKRMLAEGAPGRGNRALVFISSVNAEMASLSRIEYCASKAATAMLAKVFALRLAEAGIPVYDIRPGVIRTDINAGVRDAYTRQIEAGAISPIRRWGETEDVGKAVAGLVSGDIPFSTGGAFRIDGGLHIPRF
jgi:NAD(P)-dependent dehydrogenase (short-subunit alcohol dehydrogenase family)